MNSGEKEVTSTSTWFLYMLRCKDHSVYTGITTDIERRIQEHETGNGKGARSLRGRAPLQLVFSYQLKNRSDALKAEYHVKQLPKVKKEQLISGELDFCTVWESS